MVMYFDYDGREIESSEWVKLHGSSGRVVAKDVLEQKRLRISTIWVGLSWGEEDPPKIYETMVFPDDSYEDMGCWRWTTRDEALEGHQKIVDEILGTSRSGD